MQIKDKFHRIMKCTFCALCDAPIPLPITDAEADAMHGKPNKNWLCKTCTALASGSLTPQEKLMLERASEKAVVIGEDGGIDCPNCTSDKRFGYEIKFVGGVPPYRALVTCTRCLCAFEVRDSSEPLESMAPDGLIPFVSKALTGSDSE
ncbi:MAG: hypothetical protein HZA95_04290 [Candidatus Vogelbacteria bacterium]|nr:hypothetical protein [Candidatus Vogelbacteria bacterium]